MVRNSCETSLQRPATRPESAPKSQIDAAHLVAHEVHEAIRRPTQHQVRGEGQEEEDLRREEEARLEAVLRGGLAHGAGGVLRLPAHEDGVQEDQ